MFIYSCVGTLKQVSNFNPPFKDIRDIPLGADSKKCVSIHQHSTPIKILLALRENIKTHGCGARCQKASLKNLQQQEREGKREKQRQKVHTLFTSLAG